MATTTANFVPAVRSARALHYALWTVQLLLAALFLMSGLMKLVTPIPDLAAKMEWVAHVSPLVIYAAGTAELLGALGLVIPSATRVKPGLTPLAALGLIAVMALAGGLHASLRQFYMLPINVLLGALAAFVAYGRYYRVPIPPRT